MAVMIRHYGYRGFAAHITRQQFPWLEGVAKYGYLGVELFFVISGFVILMTALNSTPAGFVTSRITRLYPAFVCGVTLTTLAIVMDARELFSVTPQQYLVNLTMVGLLSGVEPVDRVYWTLVVEMKFYFWVFLVMCLKLHRRMEWVLTVWLAIILCVSFFGHRWAVEFALFPEWAPYFIAGATFYLVRRDGLNLHKAGLLAIAYVLSLKCVLRYLEYMETEYPTELSKFVVLGVITAIYLAFLAIALRKTAFLNRPEFYILGALTYPLYLLHERIGFILFNVFGAHIEKHLLLIGVMASMLALSYLVHAQVEHRVGPKLKRLLHATLSIASGKRAAATS